MFVGLTACGQDAARPEPPNRDAVLVLELGGSGGSLREALARRIAPRPPAAVPLPAVSASGPAASPSQTEPATPVVEPPLVPAPPAAAEHHATRTSGVVRPPADKPNVESPRPTQPVAREAEPAAKARRVTLRQGQTLYRLAVEHLGDGKRWREIAALNGWSESDLANLPANTEVALPAR